MGVSNSTVGTLARHGLSNQLDTRSWRHAMQAHQEEINLGTSHQDHRGRLLSVSRMAGGAALRTGPVDATRVVIHTQEKAGIDVVCDGELSRFDLNHPETNGMIEYFVRPMAGISTAIRFGRTGGLSRAARAWDFAPARRP